MHRAGRAGSLSAQMSLDLVLGTAQEAFIAIDCDELVTYWNPAAEVTFGYPASEAIGRPVSELIVPASHREAHRTGVARLVAGGLGRRLGQRLRLPACHRDGHRLHIELTFAPVNTEDGLQFYAFAHDITDQYRAERFRGCELAVSRALSEVPDTGQAAAAVLKAIASSLQWPYAEMWMPAEQEHAFDCVARWGDPGRDFTAFQVDRYPEGVGSLWLVAETGEPLWISDLANWGRTPRSAIAAEVGLHVTLLVPVRSGARTLGVLAFFGEEIEDPKDILVSLLTGIAAQVGQYLERRRAEELEVELARTKEHFIAVVTHELRNPLAAVLGYGNLMRGDEQLNADHHDDVEGICRNAERMSTLIDDLLDHQQLSLGRFALHPEILDLRDIVDEALDAIRAAADAKDQTVASSLAPRAFVNGDPGRLRQVVDNLLSNAVKYTPNGGRISVHLTVHDETVSCAITDTGIGIPADEKRRMFTPFYRATTALASDSPGTGLGLSVTKALIEHHHGSIDYTSDGGHGTTFTVTLPRALTQPSLS